MAAIRVSVTHQDWTSSQWHNVVMKLYRFGYPHNEFAHLRTSSPYGRGNIFFAKSKDECEEIVGYLYASKYDLKGRTMYSIEVPDELVKPHTGWYDVKEDETKSFDEIIAPFWITEDYPVTIIG